MVSAYNRSQLCIWLLLHVRQCVIHIYILAAKKGGSIVPPYPLRSATVCTYVELINQS